MATAQEVAAAKTVTINGRLSFPTFTVEQAFDLSQKGDYPVKDKSDATPSCQLLVTQHQFDKLADHIKDKFLPYCVAQEKAGEKRDSLSAAEAKALIECVDDIAGASLNTPFKVIGEKTADLVPEAVAAIKVIGSKGVNMELRAIVKDDDEMQPHKQGQVLSFPVIQPIDDTVHEMYPGAFVGVTLNLYAYHNGKHPGFSAGGTVVVFKRDMDRIGGGVTVDEDEMFLDD